MKETTKFSVRVKKAVRQMGPGLITGASDDDPSGIATYSQAGAGFGFATLWTALITFPLMASIQEMCARIGIVTQEGLTGTLKKHYSRFVLYMMMLFSFPAIILNIGADIQGMGAVANLLVPAIPVAVFCTLITALLIFCIVRYPYQQLVKILKWLCLALLLYIVVPFLVKPDWADVLRHTFVPAIHFNKEFIQTLVAILGTTISPYLFFWQATMEVEDMAHSTRKVVVNRRLLRHMKTDVNIGMLFSNFVMFFLILTTGAVMFKAGIRKIETVEQAAKALEPLAGKLSYLLFALGVLGTGFLAIPVLAGTLSYIIAETYGWEQGLDKKFQQARGFYITLIVSLIIGLLMHFLGISPINALFYTAILYGITSPVMIAIILHISNNRAIMGEYTNRRWSNISGVITFILMTASALALLYFQFA